MNREEINKLQIYLRNTFKNNNISIIPRADKTEDSAEFHINDEFYGKPKNSQEGFKMLRSLSGKSHEVITGVSLILLNKNIDYTFNQRTNVTIANMTNEEIFSYLRQYNPLDKAGSYGIQDGFSAFIKNINGCYFNVMGFPCSKFFHQYKKIFKSL